MTHYATPVISFVVLAALVGCAPSDGPVQPTVTEQPYGTTPDGKGVALYTLNNGQGMEVRAITLGGVITSIRVPDSSGKIDDVVLGYDKVEGYLKNPAYFGGVIGRYANRIADGVFTLDGQVYSLAVNNPPNHLHGGVIGFDKLVWDAETFQNERGVGVIFTHTSPDGDEGYPGTVDLRVSYTLDMDNALTVDYQGTTTAPTPINLTQHSYFNLAGEGAGDVLNHLVTLSASHFTPVSKTLIPTGDLQPVAGSPFDFRLPTPIGARIEDNHPQLYYGNGYDHNFVLDRTGSGLTLAAHVEEPTSGRVLEVFTTEPGIQFYTGNFLDGSITGKGGHVYRQRSGFCLETQHFPDSPNQPGFPNTILRPGETYRSQTVFAFGVR